MGYALVNFYRDNNGSDIHVFKAEVVNKKENSLNIKLSHNSICNKFLSPYKNILNNIKLIDVSVHIFKKDYSSYVYYQNYPEIGLEIFFSYDDDEKNENGIKAIMSLFGRKICGICASHIYGN